MDALARMQALLRELFQLDTADLDFGIYRLFHLRAEHFTRFIDEQLPRRVNEAFAALTAAELEEARRELEQLRQRCLSDIASDAIDAQGNVNPRYAKLRLCQEYEEKKLALGRVEATEAHKADVFNHLYRFFSRYYENGDFIPKLRRGMREAYAIPYDGQEVCLYWANQGQHYVKTAERLRDYAFVVPTLEGEQRVRFVLTEASVPKDNTKGDTRFFFPRPAQITYDAKTSTVTLPFEYRLPTEEEAERYGKDTQHGIFREAVPLIIKAVPNELVAGVLKEATGEADKEQISHLVQRLRHFARRHTTDYFVHRDLADFLNRELEFYLKDQVLNLADVQGDLPAKLRTIQVIREIGQEIVTFLDQIETVQGRLFEKPKFVLRTDYLCPIQNIPSELWPEILGNQAQRAAWRELFAISGRVTEGFLRAHPTLVIDTQHFNEDFKLRLLASFHDLEAAVGGFLVHGENYQALRWLNGFQRESVKCIYIDPPYNTGTDEFMYKDRYRHSSWLSMMTERLRLAKSLLAPDGAIFISVDDNEQARLSLLMETLFGAETAVALIAARTNPRGRSLDRFLAKTHEYVLCFVCKASEDAIFEVPKGPEALAEYDRYDDFGDYRELELRNRNPVFNRENRPNLYFPVYVNPRTGEVSDSPSAGFSVRVLPKNSRGEDDCWTWGPKKVAHNLHLLVGRKVSTGAWRVFRKDYLPEDGATTKAKSLWLEKSMNHENGKEELGRLFYDLPFDFPKSVDLIKKCLLLGTGRQSDRVVLDFFAGSGTMGQAALDLNREDGGDRRFVLVEMGDYFNDVIMPRTIKLLYCPEWSDGTPQNYPQPTFQGMWPDWVERTPRLVKVVRLESFEDSLHNLVTEEAVASAEPRAEAYRKALGDDAYRLRYLVRLPMEVSDTLLNVGKVEHPFSYTLEVLADDGPRTEVVDLVETFNSLYGLHTQTIQVWRNTADGREYRAVSGHRHQEHGRVLILWWDMTGLEPAVEREFLKSRINGYDQVFINGDSAVPGIESLDPIFKRLMGAEER